MAADGNALVGVLVPNENFEFGSFDTCGAINVEPDMALVLFPLGGCPKINVPVEGAANLLAMLLSP